MIHPPVRGESFPLEQDDCLAQQPILDQKKITYQRGYVNTPYQVFKTKKAHCISPSYFGRVALNRAGYKTFIRHVAWGNGGMQTMQELASF